MCKVGTGWMSIPHVLLHIGMLMHDSYRRQTGQRGSCGVCSVRCVAPGHAIDEFYPLFLSLFSLTLLGWRHALFVSGYAWIRFLDCLFH